MTDKELIIKISEDCFEELKCVELNESNEGVVFHAIKCILNGVPLPKGQGKLIERVLKAAEALKQEPKVGHWVEKEYRFEHCWAECSICEKTASGKSIDTGWGFEYSFSDYCPNCGAKMIESDEESEAAE